MALSKREGGKNNETRRLTAGFIINSQVPIFSF